MSNPTQPTTPQTTWSQHWSVTVGAAATACAMSYLKVPTFLIGSVATAATIVFNTLEYKEETRTRTIAASAILGLCGLSLTVDLLRYATSSLRFALQDRSVFYLGHAIRNSSFAIGFTLPVGIKALNHSRGLIAQDEASLKRHKEIGTAIDLSNGLGVGARWNTFWYGADGLTERHVMYYQMRYISRNNFVDYVTGYIDSMTDDELKKVILGTKPDHLQQILSIARSHQRLNVLAAFTTSDFEHILHQASAETVVRSIQTLNEFGCTGVVEQVFGPAQEALDRLLRFDSASFNQRVEDAQDETSLTALTKERADIIRDIGLVTKTRTLFAPGTFNGQAYLDRFSECYTQFETAVEGTPSKRELLNTWVGDTSVQERISRKIRELDAGTEEEEATALEAIFGHMKPFHKSVSGGGDYSLWTEAVGVGEVGDLEDGLERIGLKTQRDLFDAGILVSSGASTHVDICAKITEHRRQAMREGFSGAYTHWVTDLFSSHSNLIVSLEPVTRPLSQAAYIVALTVSVVATWQAMWGGLFVGLSLGLYEKATYGSEVDYTGDTAVNFVIWGLSVHRNALGGNRDLVTNTRQAADKSVFTQAQLIWLMSMPMLFGSGKATGFDLIYAILLGRMAMHTTCETWERNRSTIGL